MTVFKIVILLFIVVSGWAVLAGHTSVKDPHANFSNVFAGSSTSSNDVHNLLTCISHAFADKAP